ncbi:tail protein X [Psychrobacter aquaticus]|uniref:Putative inner membrane protein n=1 Tax=Psychrobacter aquaticus CMS 56 TaxID=1354303 RepID=U4T7N8_9GAMM|nr:tail protein X [Psychrobacter aquaticus]ERL56131.1 putative inner membrane protein [Psychrobacter aquaticus CMS 56]
MTQVIAQGYLQHIASDGDRWDSLSYQYYGNAIAYEQIIIANRHLSITTILSAGQIVFIPIISTPSKQLSDSLPPWLREDEADEDD